MVADLRQSETAEALTRGCQIKDAKAVSYTRARDMPQAKMFKIDLKQFPGVHDTYARRILESHLAGEMLG